MNIRCLFNLLTAKQSVVCVVRGCGVHQLVISAWQHTNAVLLCLNCQHTVKITTKGEIRPITGPERLKWVVCRATGADGHILFCQNWGQSELWKNHNKSLNVFLKVCGFPVEKVSDPIETQHHNVYLQQAIIWSSNNHINKHRGNIVWRDHTVKNVWAFWAKHRKLWTWNFLNANRFSWTLTAWLMATSFNLHNHRIRSSYQHCDEQRQPCLRLSVMLCCFTTPLGKVVCSSRHVVCSLTLLYCTAPGRFPSLTGSFDQFITGSFSFL